MGKKYTVYIIEIESYTCEGSWYENLIVFYDLNKAKNFLKDNKKRLINEYWEKYEYGKYFIDETEDAIFLQGKAYDNCNFFLDISINEYEVL